MSFVQAALAKGMTKQLSHFSRDIEGLRMLLGLSWTGRAPASAPRAFAVAEVRAEILRHSSSGSLARLARVNHDVVGAVADVLWHNPPASALLRLDPARHAYYAPAVRRLSLGPSLLPPAGVADLLASMSAVREVSLAALAVSEDAWALLLSRPAEQFFPRLERLQVAPAGHGWAGDPGPAD